MKKTPKPIGIRPMKNHNQPDLPFLLAMTATVTPHQKDRPNPLILFGEVWPSSIAATLPTNASPNMVKKRTYTGVLDNHDRDFVCIFSSDTGEKKSVASVC
jgi:hypothetical protein